MSKNFVEASTESSLGCEIRVLNTLMTQVFYLDHAEYVLWLFFSLLHKNGQKY